MEKERSTNKRKTAFWGKAVKHGQRKGVENVSYCEAHNKIFLFLRWHPVPCCAIFFLNLFLIFADKIKSMSIISPFLKMSLVGCSFWLRMTAIQKPPHSELLCWDAFFASSCSLTCHLYKPSTWVELSQVKTMQSWEEEEWWKWGWRCYSADTRWLECWSLRALR